MITDPLFDVRGKVALVTGASSGLGENFARCLAARGAVVVAAARRVDRLEALVREGGAAHALALDVTDPASVDSAGASTFSAGYDFARMLTRALWKRGVPLTVGTDAALPGLAFGVSVHQEMIELREIGLSPIEVLRAATINARRLFNAKGSGTGAVRVGERADLVLLEADPVADIQNISKVAGVFVDGRWLSSRQIDDMLAQTTRFNRDLGLQIQSRRPPDRAAK